MNIRSLSQKDFPSLLLEINDPPKELHIVGELPKTEKYLAVVGARKYSEYGKEVCEKLIEGLKGHSITIVSGMALGLDAVAHRAALKAGLPTVAVPGSGLSKKALYPRTNLSLAEEIVEKGGALVSEFEDNYTPHLFTFGQRNRIIAGMCHAVLVIEAELKSGTLITSKYAVEYNRDVLTVPNSIFSPVSEGPHMLLRLGATPITRSEDIIAALGLESKGNLFSEQDYSECSSDEYEIIQLLQEPKSRNQLSALLGKPAYVTQMILASMEIKGYIEESLGKIHLK